MKSYLPAYKLGNYDSRKVFHTENIFAGFYDLANPIRTEWHITCYFFVKMKSFLWNRPIYIDIMHYSFYGSVFYITFEPQNIFISD